VTTTELRQESSPAQRHLTDVPKFAVLSHVLPPYGLSQGVILSRLLAGFPPAEFCLLSRQDYRQAFSEAERDGSGRSHSTLAARYHFVGEGWRRSASGPGVLRASVAAAEVPVQIVSRAGKVHRVLRQERSQVLVVCSGDVVDLPAGFIAARAAGIPLLAYMFDDYKHQHYRPAEREAASVLERMSLRGARSVVVPNEFAADAYAARYGLTPRIVRNMVDEAHLALEPQATWPGAAGEVDVVYTGGIYHAQTDSFARLVDALASWDRPERVRLHIYSAQTAAQIAAAGIPPGATLHGHVAGEEMPSVLRQADVLFLPLAFASGIPEVIRTSSPGKLGEYLASGAPILAHAPRDSFLTWYLRKHNCGIVCDSPDVGELRRALALLVDDAELRSTLTTNAVACARRDFNAEDARASFARALKELV